MFERVIHRLEPVETDAEGFRTLCEEAQLVWLKIKYVHELARRRGPFPRQQDLEPTGVIVGRVPTGRKFSVSHGWDARAHANPTGDKLKRVTQALEALGVTEDNASDEDALFLDFCGLSQHGSKMPPLYKEANHLQGELLDRSPEQRRQFSFALWEMSRLYSYRDIQVIVLPQAADKQQFPGGAEAWGDVNPTACAPLPASKVSPISPPTPVSSLTVRFRRQTRTVAGAALSSRSLGARARRPGWQTRTTRTSSA